MLKLEYNFLIPQLINRILKLVENILISGIVLINLAKIHLIFQLKTKIVQHVIKPITLQLIPKYFIGEYAYVCLRKINAFETNVFKF